VFNVVEGIVDHLLLGIHHVNETAPREQWLWCDLGFLLWGGAMIAVGWWLWRTNGASQVDRDIDFSRRGLSSAPSEQRGPSDIPRTGGD